MICSSSLAVSPNKLFKVLFLPSPGPLKVQLYREVVGQAVEGERGSTLDIQGTVGNFALASGFLASAEAVQVHCQVRG